jgi:hypothetical protein
VTGSARRCRSSTIDGSFFYRRPSCTRVANPIGGPAVEIRIQFLAATANGIDVQPGDERDPGVAAMANFLGFEGGHPAALLFIESVQQEIELVMQLAVGVVLAAGTGGTLTAMNRIVIHDASPDWLLVRAAVILGKFLK